MVRRIYSFNGFRLDPAARELRHGDERVSLPVSAFDCLTYLIEHRERAIGRDELMAAIWGRTEVSDTLLSQAVVQLRHTLGDTRNEQQIIRTIPRFGYRWVVDVDVSDGIDPGDVERGPLDTVVAESAGTTRNRIAKWWLGAGALLALLGVAWGIWQFAGRESQPVPVAPHAGVSRSTVDVAVLPVESSESGEWSWLRLGLMDFIGDRLRGAGVSVVPSNNIAALVRSGGESENDEAELVRAATGARHIVRPGVTRNADGWVVHLELRAEDGSRRDVDASAADVIVAARNASDRLLPLLGVRTPADRIEQPPASELVQQVRAALLTDDIDGARRMLDSAPADLADRPDLIVQRAALDFSTGDVESAERRLQTLLARLPSETEPAMRARVQSGLGAIAIRLDRYAEAERAFSEAVSLLEGRDEPARLGRAYMGRAAAASGLGRYEPALADFSRARVALELAGDTLELARVEENEGVLDAQRGRYADALQLFERAGQRFQRFGSLAGQVKTLSNEIAAHLALLDAAAALAASDRGWPLLGRIEDDLVRHVFEYERARALAASGRLTEAQALLGKLAREVNVQHESTLHAQTRAELAHFELAAGRSGEAAALASSAVDALDAGPSYARDRAWAWLILVRALRSQGSETEAARAAERLKAWADTQRETPAPVYAALAEAELHRSERRHALARPLYQAALQRAEQGAVPVDIATVVLSYGGSLIADGDLDQASAVVGQVARFADRDFECAALQAEMYRTLGRLDAWRKANETARRLAGERTLPKQS
jgi:DNA-binding winged helix-turn-helix (wHTH) protein/tetratricopeptide (TPR) repeat protein